MKYLFLISALLLLGSCATKVPYTDRLKNEYDLDIRTMKKIQFYTSSTIILNRSESTGNQSVSDGKIVLNESNNSDRVIIYPNTKCIFEKFGESGEVYIRFEQGDGKTLKFKVRQNSATGQYYLDANWKSNQGELTYDNQKYYIDAKTGNAYLLIAMKKLKKTKRKDRIVKGMKV